MKPIKLTELFYGHKLEVTITSINQEVPLDFIPESVKSTVHKSLSENTMDGSFSFEDTYDVMNHNSTYKGIQYEGTWRIIELDFELLEKIILWKNNHALDEGLSEELFIQTYGLVDGKHFYEKWMYGFKRNILDMINYFRREGNNGPLFCDMLMQQVNKYTHRRKQK